MRQISKLLFKSVLAMNEDTGTKTVTGSVRFCQTLLRIIGGNYYCDNKSLKHIIRQKCEQLSSFFLFFSLSSSQSC